MEVRIIPAGWLTLRPFTAAPNSSSGAAKVGNMASRRVAERAGFLIEATLRKRLIHRGARVDAWVGSILRTELTRAPR